MMLGLVVLLKNDFLIARRGRFLHDNAWEMYAPCITEETFTDSRAGGSSIPAAGDGGGPLPLL